MRPHKLSIRHSLVRYVRLAATAELAAILFAAFARGGTLMQANAGISSHLVEVIEAIVLFVIAAETIVRAIAKRRGTPAEALP